MVLGAIYTVYNGKGGVDFFFERIIREIVRLSPEIRIKVFCNKEAIAGFPRLERVDCVYTRPLDQQYTKVAWLQYLSARYINRNNMDIFWIPSGGNNFPGRWDLPVVTTIHDIGEYHLDGKYDFLRTLYRKAICIPRSLQRSACIVAPSFFTASDIKEQLRYQKTIPVIHEAADPWLREEKDSAFEIIKKETGMHLEEIILSVGRTNFFAKGIDTILQSYRNIISQEIDIPPLVFAGPPGKQWRLLNDFIIKHNLKKKVFYLGPISPTCLDALYRISALVVVASRYEGFCIPVLESLRRGKPLLCSDLEVFREISADAPVFFKCGVAADLSEKALDILKGRIDLTRRIQLGREIAARYNWERAAKGYLDIFVKYSKP